MNERSREIINILKSISFLECCKYIKKKNKKTIKEE